MCKRDGASTEQQQFNENQQTHTDTRQRFFFSSHIGGTGDEGRDEGGGRVPRGHGVPQCGCKLGKNMQVLSTRLMEGGALGERRSRRGVPCEVAAAAEAKVADECEWDCNKANDPPVWTTRPWRDTLGNGVREIPGTDKQPFVALPTNPPPPALLSPQPALLEIPRKLCFFSPALKMVGCGQRPSANLWRMCRVCKCEAKGKEKKKDHTNWAGWGWGGDSPR